jgi:thymidylate synthase (FAD)
MCGQKGDSAETRQAKLNVRLLNCTADGETTAAMAAKLCYSDAGIDDLFEKVSSTEQRKFIEKIVSIGHHSVLEHVSFTFGIEGVSRALTHQLVRHRIASYSQKSQRYVKHGGGFEFIMPETVKEDPEAVLEFERIMLEIEKAYDFLASKGIPAEDARYVLPNACETKIVVTMNARELLHFFRIRCCNRAQWEIRKMSELMLIECFKIAPSIFKDSGPGCASGSCPEGTFTCGKAKEVRNKYKTLLSENDL